MKAIIEDEMADDGVKLRVLFNKNQIILNIIEEMKYFYIYMSTNINIDSENIKL